MISTSLMSIYISMLYTWLWCITKKPLIITCACTYKAIALYSFQVHTSLYNIANYLILMMHVHV